MPGSPLYRREGLSTPDIPDSAGIYHRFRRICIQGITAFRNVKQTFRNEGLEKSPTKTSPTKTTLTEN